MNRAWGLSVVVFGGWELAAYASGRLPTVSQTVWLLLGCRHRHLVRVAVVGYCCGVGAHLLRPR